MYFTDVTINQPSKSTLSKLSKAHLAVGIEMMNQIFAQVFSCTSIARTFQHALIVAVLISFSPVDSANAQLNEAANATPFSVQGNDASVNQSADQFSDTRLREYERQLNAVLKTRRDEEKLFIKQLVAQIGVGGVSTELVQTSFKWVRNRRPDTPFPFLYFERVLRIIAKQNGVAANIPPYDSTIIGQLNQPQQDTSGTDTNDSAGILVR